MWYIARASGLVAWSLLTASGLCGILLATRALGRRPRASWLYDMHQYMAGVAVGFVLVHLFTLVADNFIQFGLVDLLFPMSSPWQPGAVAWGIVAMYLLLAVEGTSVMRRMVPGRVWLPIHMLSYPMWVLASIHMLIAGTDTGRLLSAGVAVSLGIAVSLSALAALFRALQARDRGPRASSLRPER